MEDIWKREREWLANLKEGDEVAESQGFNGHHIRKAERVTAAHIIVGRDRFRRKDGYLVGSSGYSRRRIYEPTADIREEIERASLIRKLSDSNWKKLDTEHLRRVVAALGECE